MRAILLVLAVTAGTASADSSWEEFGPAQPLRPLTQLTEVGCDVDVSLRGAIAEVSMTQRLGNPGPALLAAMSELELPAGAQLIRVAAQVDHNKLERGVITATPVNTNNVSSDQVLGPDPVLVTAIGAENGRPRFRAVVQAIEPDHELSITLRWIQVAELREGSLRVVLPGRRGVACHGVVNASVGPGTSVDHVRISGVDSGTRGGSTFELGDKDLTLDVELRFKRAEPVVWTQTESLGDGWTARAITIATPAMPSPTSKRALFVIDSSRSMELVGKHHVKKLVRAIGGALPQGARIEAILYDRQATRVFGGWRTSNAEELAKLDAAISQRAAPNGSDAAAALGLARAAIAEAGRDPTMVILITDGVLGEQPPRALIDALAAKPTDLDIHAIVLAPGRLRSPDSAPLRAAIDLFGGSYVEVATADIDNALVGLADWLRPAWLDLGIKGTTIEVPDQLRAGAGLVQFELVKKAAPVTLAARRDTKLSIAARPGPTTGIAELALEAEVDQLTQEQRQRLHTRFASVDDDHALIVLSSIGKVASSRKQMIAGGGPLTRMITVDDPPFRGRVAQSPQVMLGGSAIDRKALEVMFKTQLQPAAYVCYQRAIARNGTLAGTVKYHLELGRGEVTRATVAGLGDPAFDACLLDAAYLATPPMPNPDYNTDDRTIANYPLTFSVREEKPFVIAGDADSSSPLDIDAIKPRGIKAGDTSTPLGNLRPTPTP